VAGQKVHIPGHAKGRAKHRAKNHAKGVALRRGAFFAAPDISARRGEAAWRTPPPESDAPH
jgi:hypothetical protein